LAGLAVLFSRQIPNDRHDFSWFIRGENCLDPWPCILSHIAPIEVNQKMAFFGFEIDFFLEFSISVWA
jgi:hypothetical protein